ncbi:MAG: universal stress protein family [halophilic archaeon J07HX5]|jgi:Universal stress protein family.|nr:MAG: universal stress protein family [halophilic archaeon J07HX5]
MNVLAPYDGSALAETAVKRAAEFDTGSEVIVVTVIPEDRRFALERGWVEEHETYDPAAIEDRFAQTVAEIAPAATFRAEYPEFSTPTIATVHDEIARTIRMVAHEIAASVVFVGSDNAGRVSTPVTSVGNPISKDPDYDVHIVRHT